MFLYKLLPFLHEPQGPNFSSLCDNYFEMKVGHDNQETYDTVLLNLDIGRGEELSRILFKLKEANYEHMAPFVTCYTTGYKLNKIKTQKKRDKALLQLSTQKFIYYFVYERRKGHSLQSLLDKLKSLSELQRNRVYDLLIDGWLKVEELGVNTNGIIGSNIFFTDENFSGFFIKNWSNATPNVRKGGILGSYPKKHNHTIQHLIPLSGARKETFSEVKTLLAFFINLEFYFLSPLTPSAVAFANSLFMKEDTIASQKLIALKEKHPFSLFSKLMDMYNQGDIETPSYQHIKDIISSDTHLNS